VLFYHGLYENMKKIRPLAKFLSIKLVVFATFWQAVIIVIAIDVHFLGATETYTENQVASGINSFMVCIEMAIAAVLHVWIWPAKEFESSNGDLPQLKHVLNPVDLVIDMQLYLVQPVVRKVRKKEHRKSKITSSGNVEVTNAVSVGEIPANVVEMVSVTSVNAAADDDSDSSDDEIYAIQALDRVSVRQLSPV